MKTLEDDKAQRLLVCPGVAQIDIGIKPDGTLKQIAHPPDLYDLIKNRQDELRPLETKRHIRVPIPGPEFMFGFITGALWAVAIGSMIWFEVLR